MATGWLPCTCDTDAECPIHGTRVLQGWLNARGASLVIDGVHGPKTEAMLRLWQHHEDGDNQ